MTDLHIYNSLTRKKERFEPINAPHVGLYVCGPTVYNDVHLGNLRTFISFDVVYRYLSFIGYKVKYVRNITDVGHITNELDEGDDVVLRQAKKENLDPMEIVQKYTCGFHDVTRVYNLKNPSIEPTATGHIVEQIEMVQRILDRGYAYERNGSVYFDVPKFAKDYPYGELSGRKIDELMDGYRELESQEEKNDPRDFAIWKYTDKTYPMRWNSPWGEGVPGWHLECSVMSTKYLGQEFDIHGGGMDLKFPHHECEIAQSLGADEVNPVRYWMHTNMLTMNGQKMSKSLGNSFLPFELIQGDHPMLEKGFSPMVTRFFMLQSHYSSTLDFSNQALMAAEKGYQRLMNAFENLATIEYQAGEVDSEEDQNVLALCDVCYAKMNDDFNTAETIAALFEISKKINSWKDGQISISSISESTFNKVRETFVGFIVEVLGLEPEKSVDDSLVNGLMELILEIRKTSRDKKDWATSDVIRDKLNELNVTVSDGKGSSSWSVG